jgi:hypothetical protein
MPFELFNIAIQAKGNLLFMGYQIIGSEKFEYKI